MLAVDLAPWQIGIIGIALVFSGLIKGATGAGAPIFAIPVMAAIVDIKFAILAMLVPNLMTNIWQAHRFRNRQPERRFLWRYVGGGAVGVIVGTVLLTTLSLDVLSIVVSASVLIYVAFRLSRPDWKLSMDRASRLAVPAGISAGILQGATGLAAPALLTFLNALRLERMTFVATVSLVFVTFTVVHLISLGIGGLITIEAIFVSAIALAPIAAGMALGTRLLTILSARAFDRIVLLLLCVIAAWNIIQVLS